MNQEGSFSYEPLRLSIEAGELPERITASVFLIQDGKLLLEKRPERPGIPSAGRWDTPGGHVDAGETPETTLVRELDEELGICVHSFKLGAVQDERDPSTGRFYRHYLYILVDWSGEVVPREGQHLDWIVLDRVGSLPALNPLVGYALADFRRAGWLPDGNGIGGARDEG